MALRREIELLRKRLGPLFEGRGLLVFSGALLLVIGAIAVSGFLLLRPKPAPVESLEGPAYCRPCAALSRFERSMTLALARDEDLSVPLAREDRARIVGEIAGWQRRCSTLLCSRSQGEEQACKAPSASLLTELASIDALAESLSRRTALCAEGGCQSARCEQANAATAAFSALHQDLRTLVDNPSVLVADRRHISTGFVFDQLSSLDDTVLAAPSFVADGRFAAAEGRLLFLRDEAVDAESASPDSAEGLLADRLEEVSASIEALAKGRRVGVAGGELATLWRDFSEASSRLLVEAATLRAEMHGRAGALDAMIHPETLSVGGGEKVCDGMVRLVQSTEQRVAQAMGQLSLCNLRSDCVSDEEAGVTSLTAASTRAAASGRQMLEQLANEREAAAGALRPLMFQKDAEVALTTDLQQYFTGEAIAVRPLAENNRCLNDRGSHLALTRLTADGASTQTIESHTLDPADTAALLFAAPDEAGTYRFVLETPKNRGAGQFGASAAFAVTPATTNTAGCAGFTGRWQTDFGVLTVYVRDTVVRGSYRQSGSDRAGVLVGTIDGSTLTGRWTSELGDGGARLTLGADGRSFSGTWSQYPDHYSGAGKWDGFCLGAASTSPAPLPQASGRPG